LIAASIASGAIIEFILALTVVELFGILALQRFAFTKLIWWKILPNILAGDFILLAWLSALHHAGWTITATCLLGALCSHAVDLALRSFLPD
jgi:hypothetical protein